MPRVALTIPNGYFQLWQLYLQQRDIDYTQCSIFQSDEAELRQVLSASLDTQSPYAFFLEIMQKTRQLLQCPQLSFEMAKLIRPEHFGVLGYMASRSECIAEALDYVIRFSRLVIDGAEIVPLQISQQGTNYQLHWALHDIEYALINELTMACMVQLARYIFPAQHLHLLHVYFAHAPQMALYHYQKFYDCELYFQQTQYAFVMQAEDLEIKSVMHDPSLTRLLLKQAEEAIAAKPKVENLKKMIQHYIADYLKHHDTVPKVNQVAAAMHHSTRSLQRYLQDQQTTFKQIIEHERMKRCEFFLQQNFSLFEISQRLGYSDQSALARAYKTYHGYTLLQRRRQIQQQMH